MAITIEKILKALADNGVAEEQAKKIVEELDDANPDGKPEDDQPTGDESNDPTPSDDEPNTASEKGDPSEEHNEPFSNAKHDDAEPNGADLSPTDESNATDTPPVDENVPTDEQGLEKPPVEPTEPTVPQEPAPVPQPYDDTEIKTALEEKQKVIDALTQRVESLEQALRDGGILTDDESETREPVGVDETRVPSNDPLDDPLDDVLNEINHGRR